MLNIFTVPLPQMGGLFVYLFIYLKCHVRPHVNMINHQAFSHPQKKKNNNKKKLLVSQNESCNTTVS